MIPHPHRAAAARPVRARPRGRSGLLAAAFLLLLASLPAVAQRVLVFPLAQESGPESARWLGTGLAVALDEALAMGRINSIPYEELRGYYDQEGLVDSPSFFLTAQVGLAKQLGAGILVRGTYRVQGDEIHARLMSLDLSRDPKQMGVWEDRASFTDLPALTQRLLDHLLSSMGKSVPTLAPVNPGAFESYIRGRIANDRTLQEVYFRRALEIDPRYDNARCHLAMTLKDKGDLAESRALLEALESRSYAKAYLGLLLLAEARMSQGRNADARRLLLASLKAREGAEAHVGLARLYVREKKYAEAERELVVAERFGTQEDEIDSIREEIQARVRPPATVPPSPQGEADLPPAGDQEPP